MDLARGGVDLDSMRGRWAAGWRLVLAAVVLAAVTAAIAAPAQATPNVTKAWGFNKDGELGNGTETEGTDVPVAVSGLSEVAALSGGASHSLALLNNDTVMAWGKNVGGQLGDGTTTNSDVPVAVSGLSGVAAISAGQGGNHSLALLKNGTVMAWGANDSGQLGNGTNSNSDVPVAVSGLSEVAAISAGNEHSLALLKNGTVMAWGNNDSGQLGNGTTANSDVPVAVSGLSGVISVAGGARHSLALLTNGTVMAWGKNVAGQLGDGTTTNSDVPVAVSGLSGVAAISGGGNYSLALLANGTVMAWGINSEGELGNGSSVGPETCGNLPPFACSRTPVAVSGLSGVTAISGGGGTHGMALLSNGMVKDWGVNTSGQLGNGSKGPEACGTGSCSTTPVAVCAEGPEAPCPTGPFLSNVKGIAAAQAHSLAMVGAPPPPGLPELGRCVKASTPKTGEFKGRKCIAKSPTHKGEYNWLPGPGASPAAEIHLTGTQVLETTTGKKVTCQFVFLEEGQVTSGKELTFKKMTMQGCNLLPSELRCFYPEVQETGTIEFEGPYKAEIGFIPGSKLASNPWVGVDLKNENPVSSGTMFEAFCGEPFPAPATHKLKVTGSVIGRVKPPNKMVENNEFLLSYKQSAGVQIPTAFKDGVEDVLEETLTKLAPPETLYEGKVGLAAPGELKLQESMEIKVK
jgi:alpha-tubulin suppressor-like RCC1 family protein